MDNPLLETDGLPSFSRIAPEQVEPAVDQLLAACRARIEQLTSRTDVPTWDSFVEPLEEIDDRLSRAWSPVGHLNSVMNSDELRVAYNACLPKLSEYGTESRAEPGPVRGLSCRRQPGAPGRRAAQAAGECAARFPPVGCRPAERTRRNGTRKSAWSFPGSPVSTRRICSTPPMPGARSSPSNPPWPDSRPRPWTSHGRRPGAGSGRMGPDPGFSFLSAGHDLRGRPRAALRSLPSLLYPGLGPGT